MKKHEGATQAGTSPATPASRCFRCKAGNVPLNSDSLCEACGEADSND